MKESCCLLCFFLPICFFLINFNYLKWLGGAYVIKHLIHCINSFSKNEIDNGSILISEYENDAPVGKCKFTFADGSTEEGEHINGKYVPKK